ncbi:GHKL domain-containing protein [Clostridium fermenticellae]|uniref:histidine kinase n=1 Tax=Clostridium fermenticellae TaxID=2068654 RepID=A0A386H4Q9_9CLOT|nr:ATP-binding protein [Clostridium fermenticellae]AYD40614.1 GHKL domain-containing protein [Clostridium fermenticellae]
MNIVIEIISNAIEALLFLITFEIISNNRKFIKENKSKTLWFCLIYITVNYLSTFYISKIYHTMVLCVFCILLLSYITKIEFFISCTIFFSFFSIIFITENLTEVIEMFVFDITLDQLFSTSVYSLIFLIVSKFFQIFIVLLIFKYSKHFIKFNTFDHENTFISSFIVQIGIFSMFVFIITFQIFDLKDTRIYNILVFILYFVFLIIEFKEMKKYYKFIDIKSNYRVQEKQIKNMKEIISIIRQEKHDFSNHINVIWGLCSLNKPNTVEKIKDYIDQVSDTLHSSFKYINTGNDYLDGLMSIKYNLAIKNSIDFDIMIEEPFSKLKIKENELISIISNIIDNAFEAFEPEFKIDEKKITFDTFIEDNKFCIEISDNASMIPVDIQNKIFEKGFSTKSKKTSDHGFGLYITKQLIEKNGGTITLESTPQITTFLVAFMLKK